MRVSAWCSRIPYLDHLLPIWRELEERCSDTLTLGAVYAHERTHKYVRSLGLVPQRFRDFQVDDEGSDLLIIFSRVEFSALPRGVPVVFVEHGVGANYNGVSHLLTGVRGYAPPIVAVLTTPAQEAVHRRAFGGRVHVVGCPKLDYWYGYEHICKSPPVVAFSHHWDQRRYPESRSAWPWDAEAWKRIIAKGEYEILGHKHPGDSRDIERWCARQGIEFVPTFDEIMERADLYVADNSSTLYEFAATGRPVVVLSPPWYRREVSHGVRFWDHVPGVECALADHLEACIEEALKDVPARRVLRERAVEAVYGPLDGQATERVVKILEDLASCEEALVDLPYTVRSKLKTTYHAPTYRRDSNTVEV